MMLLGKSILLKKLVTAGACALILILLAQRLTLVSTASLALGMVLAGQCLRQFNIGLAQIYQLVARYWQTLLLLGAIIFLVGLAHAFPEISHFPKKSQLFANVSFTALATYWMALALGAYLCLTRPFPLLVKACYAAAAFLLFLLVNLLDTNAGIYFALPTFTPREALSAWLFDNHLHPLMLLLVSVLGVTWGVFFGISRRPKSDRPETPAGYAKLINVLLFAACLPAAFTLPGFFNQQYLLATGTLRDIRTEQEQFKHDNGGAYSVLAPATQHPRLNLVIFVNDAASKTHFNLYGYPRQTNAGLASFQNDLITFQNVVSPDAIPERALAEILTPARWQWAAADDPKYSLVRSLGALGYKTHWYSDVEPTAGTTDSLHTQFANDVYFSTDPQKQQEPLADPDSSVIKHFKDSFRAVSDKVGNAYFLHSGAGRHGFCNTRQFGYPAHWKDEIAMLPDGALFGEAKADRQSLDCHDAMIRDLSQQAGQILATIRQSPSPTVFVYLSAAGSVAAANRGNFTNHAHQQTEVPLFAYFNPAARKLLGSAWQAAQRNKVQPVESTGLYHSILDLAGAPPGFYNFQIKRSVFSNAFATQPRQVLYRGERGYVSLETAKPTSWLPDLADPIEQIERNLAQLSPRDRDKVCADGNNSYLKFLETKQLFGCAETDLVIDKSDVWASHGEIPEKSKRLPLRAMLVSSSPLRGLWLDMKNLNDANAPFFFSYLRKFTPPSMLRRHVLVETPFLPTSGKTLAEFRAFAAEGWMLDYYIPTEQALACSVEPMSGDRLLQCGRLAKEIIENAGRAGYRAISFNAQVWPFIKRFGLARHFELYTWDPYFDITNHDPRSELFNRVQYFIVFYPSPFDTSMRLQP